MSRPKLGSYPADSNPPGGPLKFYAAFDGTTTNPLMNAVDSIRANFASTNQLASVAGISGKAVQGADGKYLSYTSANDIKTAASFSVAFWIKNAPAVGRTEFLFSLVDDKYGWHHSAVFLLIENQTASRSTLKLGLMDQWLEFTGGNDFQKPLFDGNWHHLAFVYNHTTSKMAYYFDGAEYTGLPANVTDVKSGGAPRGAVDFSTVNQLVIGGWNKHANIAGPTDGWISTYTGGLDQFRLYGSALTAAEVASLYSNKK
ncbi:MAG: LamG-like jellyroll fold domain-containing protein [Ferruginibacter sp.]